MAGDSAYNDDTMGSFKRELEGLIPNAFVHLVAFGGNQNNDQASGFWGMVTKQIDTVCAELKEVPELAHGFHAIGLSQGGLFLRGYVEQCNQPPIRNLVTLGAPHGGIFDTPACGDHDYFCKTFYGKFKQVVYTQHVQTNIIPGQYFKDPARLDQYYQSSTFLPAINNELEPRNATHKVRLTSLGHLVMVRYAEDEMVKPPLSSWFASLELNRTVPLRESQLYQEDWLGLRTLDENGQLHLVTFPGRHLEYNAALFARDIVPYLVQPIAQTWSWVTVLDAAMSLVF
ncbi:hypothetical protein H4R34_000472 [Dimargaris verticillata]|uniref:palmitoyl-protein hydrolase n=1 Tax=Dimargaris verticillata TaxID=2761393 RepID=A0A9W8BD73_9FUNG|nr:hypothetical protein H4R34_000472 [Dimargaris verticillata]